MSNTNEQSIDFYKKFQGIKYDMSKASLEDVKNILDHYNQGPIEVNGVNYHYNINPLDAACLNARYKQLTGQDHPTFISEQDLLTYVKSLFNNQKNKKRQNSPLPPNINYLYNSITLA